MFNFFKKKPIITDYPDCINPRGTKVFNVLTIADTHGSLTDEDLDNIDLSKIDMVLLLGDITYSEAQILIHHFDIEDIRKTLFYGVLGNHDEPRTYQANYGPLRNVHMFPTLADGKWVAGFEGSIRYKKGDYVMYTNEESEALLKKIMPVDLLLTHDKPNFDKAPENPMPHSGLTGIGKYIKQNSPKLVLHGHLHKRYIEEYGDTIIKGCYGIEQFKIKI